MFPTVYLFSVVALKPDFKYEEYLLPVMYLQSPLLLVSAVKHVRSSVFT